MCQIIVLLQTEGIPLLCHISNYMLPPGCGKYIYNVCNLGNECKMISQEHLYDIAKQKLVVSSQMHAEYL